MNASDLEYILGRLDRAHVVSLAAQAREAWDSGERAWELAYMPGDGTHYGLFFTVLRSTVPVFGAPGGGSGDIRPYTITGCKFDDSFVILNWIQRERMIIFGRHDFVHPSWVEKLDGGEASSLAVAVLLNEITQVDPDWQESLIANTREDEAVA